MIHASCTGTETCTGGIMWTRCGFLPTIPFHSENPTAMKMVIKMVWRRGVIVFFSYWNLSCTSIITLYKLLCFVGQDFGLSGIPCAIIHTFNKEVLHALETLQQFHNVPSITQLQLSSIISDLGNAKKCLASAFRLESSELWTTRKMALFIREMKMIRLGRTWEINVFICMFMPQADPPYHGWWWGKTRISSTRTIGLTH